MSTESIADEHQIRSLVHRYADAASRRDPVAVVSTFTADGEWQAPELGHFQGRDAMLVFLHVDAQRLERISTGTDVGCGHPRRNKP